MYSTGQIDNDIQRYVSGQISREVEKRKLASYNIPQLRNREDIKTTVPVKVYTWTEEATKRDHYRIHGHSLFEQLHIYMFIFMYGSMVIRVSLKKRPTAL